MIKGFCAVLGCVCAMGLGVVANVAFGKTPAPDAGETVTLPIVLPDEQGIRWDLQNDGSIADGGSG